MSEPEPIGEILPRVLEGFDDLPPRKTLRQFFAQIGPRTGEVPMYLRKPVDLPDNLPPEPAPAPEFQQPQAERVPGPLFDREVRTHG